jgi:2-methylcitrate dehydratase PrpD
MQSNDNDRADRTGLPPVTAQLTDWLAVTGAEDLPDDVRHQVRRILVDYLASAFAGVGTDAGTLLLDYMSRTDRDTSATVIGTSSRLSPAGAALVNGTAAHALDLDDGYTPGACHPAAPICSAVLAAAEQRGSSPPDVMRAVALGYEVACRMAGASHPSQRRRGFHNTALVGTFGAMVGVAALHSATSDQFMSAFGNAASHAGGLLSFLDDGTDLKRVHAGKAARDGLVSAELAVAGLRGPSGVLESPHGYFAAFTGGVVDVGHLVGDLGEAWRVLGTYNKPYPCCRHVHGAIDAALELRTADGFDPEHVESVDVATFAIAADHDRTEVNNTLDAQMSLPYSVAVAIVHGSVEMGHFEAGGRADAAVEAITRATTVRDDPAYTASYPSNRPARVTIRSAGREYVGEVLQPYGEPANPMSDADLDHKLRTYAVPLLGPERAAKIAEQIWAFGEHDLPWSLLATDGTSVGDRVDT